MKSSDGWFVASIIPPIDEAINSKYRYQGWKPCIDWCRDQFSDAQGRNWHYLGEGIFEFRYKQDYIWFTLKWKQ